MNIKSQEVRNSIFGTENDNMFEVEKIQLYPGVPENANGVVYETPKHFGVYRTDNGKHLGTVGEGYTPKQNIELYNIIAEAASIAGLSYEDIKFLSLSGGKKVSFQVKLPDWNMSGNKDDKVIRYATALNSHDGSSSLGIGATGYRVWCRNTWMQAFKEVKKARHTQSLDLKVADMASELIRSVEHDMELYKAFEKSKEISYNEVNHGKFIKELVGYDLNDLLDYDKNPTRKRNIYNALSESIAVEVAFQPNEWGLFNGVTRYVNHVEAVKKDDPLAYISYGGGKTMVDKALNVLALS